MLLACGVNGRRPRPRGTIASRDLSNRHHTPVLVLEDVAVHYKLACVHIRLEADTCLPHGLNLQDIMPVPDLRGCSSADARQSRRCGHT